MYSAFPAALQALLQQPSSSLEANAPQNHHDLVGKLLLLLSRRNGDRVLREMVVRQLEQISSNDECVLYASQLVQALKWDTHDFNALIRFLLRKALECSEFAHALYWQLQVGEEWSCDA